MKKLVSIIIPAYNIEDYIIRCLESVSAQTYDELEIIIVDDGSTDNTGKLLDAYAQKDERVIVMHKSNNGVSSARNLGLQHAKGDYIGFVDGDDVIDDDMFEFLVMQLESYKADIAHCGYRMVFPSRTDYYYNTKIIVEQSNIKGINDLFLGQQVEPSIWNKLYKRELIDGVEFREDIKNTEDLLFNAYVFEKAEKSIYIDIPKYSYMIRENSAATSKLNTKKLMDPYTVSSELLSHFEMNEAVAYSVFQRYIEVLTGISGISGKLLDQTGRKFQSEVQKFLRQETTKILNNRELRGRIRIKAVASGWLPPVYRLAKELYGRTTGSKYKYEVR